MSPNADASDPEVGHEATVIESLPNSMFRLRLSDGRQVTAHAAQNSRMTFVRLVAGDVVRIGLSPFDPQRARILALTGRHRAKQHPTNPFPHSQREEP